MKIRNLVAALLIFTACTSTAAERRPSAGECAQIVAQQTPEPTQQQCRCLSAYDIDGLAALAAGPMPKDTRSGATRGELVEWTETVVETRERLLLVHEECKQCSGIPNRSAE